MQEKNQWEVASQEYDHKLKEKMEHDKRRLQAWQKREERLEEEVQVYLIKYKASLYLFQSTTLC